MNDDSHQVDTNQADIDRLNALKRLAAIVYLCQVLSFVLAGLPLLVGAVINLMKQDEVKGTWLESHFDWQVRSAWMALAGFALAGLTFEFGVGFFILIITIVLLVYRIVIGWNALHSDQPVNE